MAAFDHINSILCDGDSRNNFILYLTTDLRLDGTDAECGNIFRLVSLPAERLSLRTSVCNTKQLEVNF
jgi:hypothetical protein